MSYKTIGFLAALATILSILIGGVIAIEGRYAHCEDVKQVDKRLETKIRADRLDALQQRYWRFEDRYGKTPSDPIIRQDMREQQERINQEKQELERPGTK